MAGLHEEPYSFDGHVYRARRSASPEGDWWQVFRADRLAPYGYIQTHVCADQEIGDRIALTVFDAGGRQVGLPNQPGRGACPGPCCSGYQMAVAWLYWANDANIA